MLSLFRFVRCLISLVISFLYSERTREGATEH